jgi:hypothetical protein
VKEDMALGFLIPAYEEEDLSSALVIMWSSLTLSIYLIYFIS